MKKILSLALVAVMAIMTLASCGGSGEPVAKVIDIELTEEEYAFGVDKTQPELLDQVNAFLTEIQSNGKFDEICNNYFGDGTPVPVTSVAEDASKDQLIVATNASFEPFEYMEGDKYLGIDMEIAAALAEYLGKELVISNMDFDAVCLSVGQQKCDIAMAGLTVNEERTEYVTFSNSYYSASQKLIVPASNTEFDACTTAADVEAILNAKDASTVIGVQNGNTAQFYIEGSEDWGFAGLPCTCTGYKAASQAVQDMVNGNIQFVITDAAPAAAIVESINEMN